MSVMMRMMRNVYDIFFPNRRHKTTCFWSQECLTGADIVVQVGDEVTKDEPITTNPNVGGFGQAPVDRYG